MKSNKWKNISFVKLHSKFLAPTVNYKMHLGNFGAPHIHTMLKNSCSAKLHTTFLTLQTLYLFFYVFVQILIYSFFKDFKRKTKAKKISSIIPDKFQFQIIHFLYSQYYSFFRFWRGKMLHSVVVIVHNSFFRV